MENCKINLIVICGPTASGKTGLGISTAFHYNGEIISADSRQVYRGMDIGTGKDLGEYKRNGREIPYHLIDIADPSDVYTVFHYRRDFLNAFKDIRARRKLPVMVGGTGLYIEAVLRDFQIPSIPENPILRRELMMKEKELLIDELKRADPLLYRKTDLSSKKRIVRSIEIAAGKKSQSSGELPLFPELKPLVLCVKWERPALRERIAERLKNRLNDGMIDEVRGLLESGITMERFSLFGMEYKHIARFLSGEVTREQMVEELRIDICQLAKRQETWFRGMERRGVKMSYVPHADFTEAKKIIGEQLDGDIQGILQGLEYLPPSS